MIDANDGDAMFSALMLQGTFTNGKSYECFLVSIEGMSESKVK